MAKRTIFELLNGVTRFGRLTVVGEGRPIIGAGHPARRARCVCDCGQTRDMQPAKLRAGTYVSCGCFSAERSRERFTKHGASATRTYRSWISMIQRCEDPRNANYPSYGGRGIVVCERWRGTAGFARFHTDMGDRPIGMTLDRIDNDGPYDPRNCRWATAKLQQSNRRNSTNLTYGGLTMNPQEWSLYLGFSKNVVTERLKRGWDVERALSTRAR